MLRDWVLRAASGLVIVLGTFVIAPLLYVAVVSAFLAIPGYFLWNWLVPPIFALQRIDWWQTWGLTMLAGIFLRGTVNVEFTDSLKEVLKLFKKPKDKDVSPEDTNHVPVSSSIPR